MPPETKVLYEFGRFRCDPREHLLLCEGKPVSLSPKSFDILLALIQSNGRLVTKDELMHQVWPDSFVEEGNLTVNISALRRALGAFPQGQQYIETVPKKGYRFVAAVTQLRDDGKTAAQIPAVEEPSALPKIAPASAPASRPRRWWPLAALPLVAVMVIVLVSSRPARLTDKDTVVLADFSNTTGDPVFDGALRQGLSSQLEQSPFLNLLSDERIAQTLSLMAQPKDSRLNQELSREICQRTASTAVLNGAIAQVGTQYLLTLKAINCSNGESLGSAEEQATDKNHVLDALGKVAAKMRNRLGESLASVEKYDAPAENVTTPSLEALKAYSLGCQAMAVKSDYSASIPLFQRAISLDRNFAMAYARMGTSYDDLNETVRATEVMRRAYELRKRVSEREEFYIAEHYEILVTGNLEAARKVDELSALTYPRNTPFSNLGFIYSELGDYDKALAAFQNALKLDPETGNRYAPLVSGYLQLNRLDEAKATGREAERHNIDYPEVHLNLYWVNFLQHDAAGMEQEAAGMMGRPGHEDQMLNYEADTAAYGGQIAKAHELTQRAVEAARKVDEKEAPALYLANAAVREALLGNSSLAKQQAQAALAISNSRDAEALSAIALGLTDNSMQATRLADDLARRFPQDTIVQFNYLPSIRAATLLQTKNYLKAVEILEKAAPYELGGNIQTLNFVLYPVYLRGEAYLAMKQGAAAAAEFQKIINHPGVVRSEPIGALARLELGRVFLVAGDQAKAKANYQEFFTLWENADPDIPLLRQARTEYSRLQ